MKLAVACLLVGSAAASSSSIKADSPAGGRILSKARRLGGGNGEMTWVTGYSLRFEKCATSSEYYGGYFGGNQEGGNNNNNNNNNQNGFNGVYQQRLVHFKLCPSDSCGSGCKGGDYVIDMNEFVEAYMEYKQEAAEQECEMVKENCYCENANDDEACEAQCYMSAGIYEQCAENNNNGNNNNNNGQQEFDLQDALECRKLDFDDEAVQAYNYQNYQNNQNYQYGANNQANGQYGYNYNWNQEQQQDVEFFVGPYCSANGKSILLGVFMDETCSFSAPDGIYEKFNYGQSLPYSSQSIISHDCISCLQVNNDNNQNNQNNQNNYYNNYNNNGNNANGQNGYYYNNGEAPEALEVCQRLYEASGKCERNMEVYGVYPNTLACDFIKGLGGGVKTRISGAFANARSHAPGILAGVFAVTTVAFGGVAYYLHRKSGGGTVGLMRGGGSLA